MMKLYLEDEDGNRVKIKSVEGVGAGDLVVKIDSCMRKQDIENMEEYLGRKFERKVIVLDGTVSALLTVLPFKK